MALHFRDGDPSQTCGLAGRSIYAYEAGDKSDGRAGGVYITEGREIQTLEKRQHYARGYKQQAERRQQFYNFVSFHKISYKNIDKIT